MRVLYKSFLNLSIRYFDSKWSVYKMWEEDYGFVYLVYLQLDFCKGYEDKLNFL